MAASIRVLDATLRDGGQGLVDLFQNRITDCFFSEEDKLRMISQLSAGGIDVIELGAIGPSDCDRSPFAIYQNIEELSRYLPELRPEGVMYAGLYIGPDTRAEDIPDWSPSLVEAVRVILRYSELQKSLDYCACLAQKGYKVFVQPMLTMRYTHEELDLICRSANEMGAYACYIVDSYGYMQPGDIARLFFYLDERLNAEIAIGFHAHNNMGLAYSNALSFLQLETERARIVDSCATGMGQGAGNLQTELILPYLNEHCGKHYGYEPILELCDRLESQMMPDKLWGFSMTYMLPALYKTAYKYAMMMRCKYHLSFAEMNRLLRDMPDDLRMRYTPENLSKIMQTVSESKSR